jgi:intergrase/recombinase
VRSPGFEPGIASLEGHCESFSLNWLQVGADFLKWIESKHYSKVYAQSIVSCLKRYVKDNVLTKPMDVVKLFAGLSDGQRHNLNRAVKALFNFYEVTGVDERFLRSLRKAVPKDVIGFDVNVPSVEQIVASLKLVSKAYQMRYRVAYNLAVDSGLRVTELAKFMKDFDARKVEHFNGFHVAALGYFRGTKLAYFAFFTDYTFNLLQSLRAKDLESFDDRTTTNYFRNVDGFEEVVRFKYLRKFANDTMTSEELNIPESVADFTQGRTPKSIAAKHYMQLKRKATQFYPRCADYITTLRRKAGLIPA